MHPFKLLKAAVAVYDKKFGKDVTKAVIKYEAGDPYIILYANVDNFIAICLHEFNNNIEDIPSEIPIDRLKYLAEMKKRDYEDTEFVCDVINDGMVMITDDDHTGLQIQWGQDLGDIVSWDDTLTTLCRVVSDKSLKEANYRPGLQQVFTCSDSGKIAVTNGHFLVCADYDQDVCIPRHVGSLMHKGIKTHKISPVFINNVYRGKKTVAEFNMIGNGCPVIISSDVFEHNPPDIKGILESFDPKRYTTVSADRVAEVIARIGKGFTADELFKVVIEDHKMSIQYRSGTSSAGRGDCINHKLSIGKGKSFGYADNSDRTVAWRADYITLLIDIGATEFLITNGEKPSVFVGDVFDSLLMPKRL